MASSAKRQLSPDVEPETEAKRVKADDEGDAVAEADVSRPDSKIVVLNPADCDLGLSMAVIYCLYSQLYYTFLCLYFESMT